MQKDQWTYLNCLSVVLVNIDPYSSFLEFGIHTFHHIKIHVFLVIENSSPLIFWKKLNSDKIKLYLRIKAGMFGMATLVYFTF